LQKISALRRAHALAYALDRDTMLDKLEAFFEDAMKGRSYSAALRALLAQAELSGLRSGRRRRIASASRRGTSALSVPGDACLRLLTFVYVCRHERGAPSPHALVIGGRACVLGHARQP